MNTKQISGIVVAFLGAALLFFAHSISEQVAAGQQKINRAQKQVNQSETIFSVSPVTKDIGKQVTAPVQEKIKEGQQEVDTYGRLAQQLHVAGIILLVLGAGLFLFGLKK